MGLKMGGGVQPILDFALLLGFVLGFCGGIIFDYYA